jgi:hypothetical protein
MVFAWWMRVYKSPAFVLGNVQTLHVNTDLYVCVLYTMCLSEPFIFFLHHVIQKWQYSILFDDPAQKQVVLSTLVHHAKPSVILTPLKKKWNI